MDEDTKRQHDALFDEYKTAWDSLMRRTGTEWKVSIAFWTALAAFSAIVLRDAPAAHAAIGKLSCPVAVASGFVFIAHLWFSCGIIRGNNIDQKKMQVYEEAMRSLTGVEWPPRLETSIEQAASRRGLLGYWAHYAQLLVTLILALAAPTVVWWMGSLSANASAVLK